MNYYNPSQNFNNFGLFNSYNTYYPFKKIKENYEKLYLEKKQQLIKENIIITEKPKTIKLSKLTKIDLEEQKTRIEQWKKEQNYYHTFLPKPKEKLPKIKAKNLLSIEEIEYKIKTIENQNLKPEINRQNAFYNRQRFLTNGEINILYPMIIYYFLVFNGKPNLIFQEFNKLTEIKPIIDDILGLKDKDYIISSLDFYPKRFINSYKIYYNNYVYPFEIRIHGFKYFVDNRWTQENPNGLMDLCPNATIYF
jgi:hypothetical protein